MRTKRSRKLITIGAVFAVTSMFAGCASETNKTATADESSSSRTIEVMTGQQPNSDAVVLATGASDADIIAAIDAAIEQIPTLAEDILDESGVPGMAIAVVHGGEMIYSEGFGVKKTGENDTITPETVFQIASLSKPISATTVAKAMSDGAIEWETPVAAELPDFEMADPFVTENATVSDYFSHRSGLSTGAGEDLEDIGYDREYILERLHMQPLDPFRSSYNYSNMGMTVGAEATAAALGSSWEDAVDQLVYTPIGMSSSSSLHDDFLGQENRASLHTLVDEEFQALYDRDPDPQSPAGGVSSNVVDLSKWMNVVLAQGELDGQEYIDPEALAAATTGQVISGHPSAAEVRTSMYGYGFNVGVQPGGRTTISHSGAFVQGAGTSFQLIPSLDFGIVTLTNAGPVGVPEALNAQVLDLVQFGQIKRDWITDYRNAIGVYYNPVGNLVDEEAPADAMTPENLNDFTGTFVSDYFGTLTITNENDTLVAALGPDGGYVIDLSPWDADTFSFEPTGENAPADSLSSATFERTADQVTSVTLDFFDAQGLGMWKKSA